MKKSIKDIVLINKEHLLKWLPHIAGWMLFLILPIFVLGESYGQTAHWRNRYFFQLIFAVLAFYGNYLLLVPRYFFSGKKSRFFITLFIFALSIFVLFQILTQQLGLNGQPHIPPYPERHLRTAPPPMHLPATQKALVHPRLFDDAVFIIMILGFSTGMGILQRLRRDKNLQKEMDKAHIETELAFLKNQINPHFFFNSLNNIYALIAIDSKAAQKSIEKLSGLMRYLIYDSNVKTVKLTKEFEFCRNYIDLMKQRLTSKVKLSVNIQQEIPDIEIPPLVFIPFIENAFKHGVSYRGDSFISITLIVHRDTIRFSCKNSIPKFNQKEKHEKGGMGILNIRKRLELLYGANAQLIQHKTNDIYHIELTLPREYTT